MAMRSAISAAVIKRAKGALISPHVIYAVCAVCAASDGILGNKRNTAVDSERLRAEE